MSEAVCQADRRRYHVRHACGFPLIGYPYRVGDQVLAGFAAGMEHVQPFVERGQVICRCPQCGGDLRMSWEEFQKQLGETFRP
jgi:hypothetical protein